MNKVTLPFMTFEYKKPIVYINFNQAVLVDEKMIMEMIEFRHKLVNNKPHLVLTTFNAAVEFTPEARKVGATNNPNSIAHAVVVKWLGQRLVTDSYKQIEKPSYPLGIFADENEAEKWLLSHLN